jgi:hypothetical protein
MISATNRHDAASSLATLTHESTTSTTPSKSTTSFAQQLSTAIEGGQRESATETQLRLRASEVSGQKSGGSQFLATAMAANAKTVTPISSGPNAGSTTATASTTTPSDDSDIPTMLGMGPVAGTAPVQQQQTTATPVSTADETEADAYWSAQPAAVQALRNMPDGEAKDQLALKLANEGYSIDTQIMVWGWDPQMTMTIRENQGYSWVPSYGEANIPVGPGLSMPDNPTNYNPAAPPAGSIQVSTAFAVGTIQNPLVQSDSAS